MNKYSVIKQLPETLWNEIKPLFAHGWPNEVIVAIYGDKFEQLENASDKPTHSFKLTDKDHIRLTDNPPTLFLHSHPHGSPRPSDTDHAQQINTGWNWGIVPVKGNYVGEIYDVGYPECWGPDIETPPLLGRSYLWGIRDCYSLCVDWYKEHGVHIEPTAGVFDPAPYPQGVWQKDQFTYWPPRRGFKEKAPHERLWGDFVTMMVRANYRNHVAVYLGEGKFLHQLGDRTSEIWTVADEQLVIERMNMKFWTPPSQPQSP